MNGLKLLGLVLLIAGILALVYGGFTWTQETHEADLGPLSVSLEDRERIDIPVWAGVATCVVGAGLILFGRGTRSILPTKGG